MACGPDALLLWTENNLLKEIKKYWAVGRNLKNKEACKMLKKQTKNYCVNMHFLVHIKTRYKE